jgi:Transposase DDE domain
MSAPHVEVYMAGGYAVFLLACAAALECLSAHTHRRALRYRTAGFAYDEQLDAWQCPEGQHLWPHEFDHERRLVRYRAKAHICNGCPVKDACTNSDRGREVVRPLDPWPHSEAGRFHRVLSLVLVGLAGLVLVVEAGRHHAASEAALLLAGLLATGFIARWLARDLRAHPANFPAPAPPDGLRITAPAEVAGDRSRWASLNHTKHL